MECNHSCGRKGEGGEKKKKVLPFCHSRGGKKGAPARKYNPASERKGKNFVYERREKEEGQIGLGPILSVKKEEKDTGGKKKKTGLNRVQLVEKKRKKEKI